MRYSAPKNQPNWPISSHECHSPDAQFLTNMHQIQFRPRLCPRPRWSSLFLQRSLDPLDGGVSSTWRRLVASSPKSHLRLGFRASILGPFRPQFWPKPYHFWKARHKMRSGADQNGDNLRINIGLGPICGSVITVALRLELGLWLVLGLG